MEELLFIILIWTAEQDDAIALGFYDEPEQCEFFLNIEKESHEQAMRTDATYAEHGWPEDTIFRCVEVATGHSAADGPKWIKVDD